MTKLFIVRTEKGKTILMVNLERETFDKNGLNIYAQAYMDINVFFLWICVSICL